MAHEINPKNSISIKLFSQTKMVNAIKQCFKNFTDNRNGTGKNLKYSMLDAAMSAFSVFFMQSSSFLEHQKSLQKQQSDNNAQSLFGVHQIPSENQIRNLLDGVNPDSLHTVYHSILNGLQQCNQLKRFETLNGSTLIALDGIF